MTLLRLNLKTASVNWGPALRMSHVIDKKRIIKNVS